MNPEGAAYMLPIVEMASKPVHITDPLYLYEPSGQRKRDEREERERTIARIVAKPSLSQPSDAPVASSSLTSSS